MQKASEQGGGGDPETDDGKGPAKGEGKGAAKGDMRGADGGESGPGSLAAASRVVVAEDENGPLQFAWDGDQRGATLSAAQRPPPDALMRWSNMRPSPKPIAPEQDLEQLVLRPRPAKAPTLPRVASMMYSE